MFAVGDIVRMLALTAGKKKYHLCVCSADENGVLSFLFINSGSGYDGDFLLEGDPIECIPYSPTGESVISCSLIVRCREDRLKLFKAEKLGQLDIGTAAELLEFIKTTPVLSGAERRLLQNGLEHLIENDG